MDQLVENARKGNPEAEKQLFSDLFVRFRRFAESKVGYDNADDIAQEACIIISTKLKSQELEGDFYNWAHGVLKMIIRRHFHSETKKNEREVRIPENVEFPARRSSQPLLRHHLLECMKNVLKQHGKYARIYNLHQLGFSAKEVCDKMGLNIDTYYVYLGRGRSLLEECLSGKGLSV